VVPLIGYVDRFSARTGERIAVKVSSRLAEPYRADLVRIIHGDANPAGPGLKFEEVEATFAGTYPSRFQPAHSGSYGIVTRDQAIPLPDPCTIVVRVQPWLPDARRQTVLAIAGGPTLWVTAEGAGLTLGAHELRVAAPDRWVPAGREVLEIFQDAGVHPKTADDLHAASGLAVTCHSDRSRSGVGHEMLKSAWEPGPHHLLRWQQRQDGEQNDAAPREDPE